MNTVIYTELPLIQAFLFLEHYPEISRDITRDIEKKIQKQHDRRKGFYLLHTSLIK